MSEFDAAFEWILEVEGGMSNDPRDPGRLTKFGIAQRYHPDVDVATLTVEKAKAIYKQEYRDRARCGDLPGRIGFALFDAAVNQGVDKAVRLLQLALRVHPDGVVGSRTIEAAQRGTPGDVLDDFQSHRALAYADGNKVFRRGWFRRQFKLQRKLA